MQHSIFRQQDSIFLKGKKKNMGKTDSARYICVTAEAKQQIDSYLPG
jgi:hypothetical protein